MSRIEFKRITPEQSNIYDDDGYFVGEVYRQSDFLNPGGNYYVIWLDDDPRGPTHVHDRSRIRETAQRMVDTHPLG